jgi:hypothetical protein
MNERGVEPSTPDEARARDALRSLPPPSAGAAFRERLKRDFVAGRFGEPRVLRLPVAWYRRPLWRLVPAAAAALVVVAAVANRGPAWMVLASAGEGVAVVDQVPVPMGHIEELQRRLRPGVRLQIPVGSEIELASPGGLVVQVTSGTEFRLPAVPGHWVGRRVAGEVRHGEIRVTTGPAFHGARLHVETPEAIVVVTGTTLAVICEPGGTCVCVFDGQVSVGAKGEHMEPVVTGRRRFVFNDGRLPESAEIRPVENERLAAFRLSRGAWLEGRDE